VEERVMREKVQAELMESPLINFKVSEKLREWYEANEREGYKSFILRFSLSFEEFLNLYQKIGEKFADFLVYYVWQKAFEEVVSYVFKKGEAVEKVAIMLCSSDFIPLCYFKVSDFVKVYRERSLSVALNLFKEYVKNAELFSIFFDGEEIPGFEIEPKDNVEEMEEEITGKQSVLFH